MRFLQISGLIAAFLASQTLAMGPEFFQHMFQGGGGGQHPPTPKENAPSNSDHYQTEFDYVVCDKYLCPGTLACVHFPHHCPCAFPNVEDKVELADGIAICASKGGWKPGETKRKIELARKGLL